MMFLLLTLTITAHALTVTLSPTSSHLDKSVESQPWHVRAVLDNTDDQSTSFPLHNSVLDGPLYACSAFQVFDQTTLKNVKNQGALAKRQLSEDITVTAGESMVVDVDLSRCFAFESNHKYTIELSETGPHAAHRPQSKAGKTTFVSPKKSVVPHLQNRHSTDAHSDDGHLFAKKAVESINCDASQWAQVKTAMPIAETATLDAVNNNLIKGCGGDQFTRFFGEYDQQRFYVIHNNFKAIHDRFQAQTYNVECNSRECDPGVYAFVYPTDPDHVIHVCDVFWQVSNTLQFDSQPGTLIHEMSHFATVANTNDHQYGVSGCEELARTDPCKAIDNADSHEFYIEQILSPQNCCVGASSSLCGSLGFCAWDSGACNELSNIGGPGPEEQWSCCTSMASCFPGCTDETIAGGLEWVDSAGDNCFAYWDNGWCERYGSGFRANGFVANEACCACGGGNTNELYYYQIFQGSTTCSDFNSIDTTRMERAVCTQTPHLTTGVPTWTWLTTSGGKIIMAYYSDDRCMYDETNLGPQPNGDYTLGTCYAYGDSTSIMISATANDGGGTVAGDCVHDHSQYGSETCDTAWNDFGITCNDLENDYGWDCEGCACPGDQHDCEVDHSDYGSESCDTAWTDFRIDCAELERVYGWDCSGCECPGDN